MISGDESRREILRVLGVAAGAVVSGCTGLLRDEPSDDDGSGDPVTDDPVPPDDAEPGPSTATTTDRATGTTVSPTAEETTVEGPDIEISDTGVRRPVVSTEDSIRIRVRLRNRGGAEGAVALDVRIDGEPVASEEVTVPGNGERDVAFEYDVSEPGAHTIAVNDEQAGEVRVLAPKSGQWPMWKFDPAATGHNPDATPPVDGFSELWRFEGTGPAVVLMWDDQIIVPTETEIHSVDPVSGAVNWSSTNDAVLTGAALTEDLLFVGDSSPRLAALNPADGEVVWESPANGPLETIVVWEDMVFGGNFDRLQAFTTDGSPVWTWDDFSGGGIDSTPVVYDDAVFVGLSTDVGTVAAVDPHSGTTRWREETAHRNQDVAATDQRVFVQSAYGQVSLEVFTTAGSKLWTKHFERDDRRPTMVVLWDDMVYFPEPGGVIHAADQSSGETEWTFNAGGPLGQMAVADGVVYVGGWDNTLYALDATDGSRRGSYISDRRLQSPTVVDDLVLVWEGDDLVAFEAE